MLDVGHWLCDDRPMNATDTQPRRTAAIERAATLAAKAAAHVRATTRAAAKASYIDERNAWIVELDRLGVPPTGIATIAGLRPSTIRAIVRGIRIGK
jgi:hypothetical protein